MDETCQTVTVPEAASILGIGRRTAYEQLARGEFPLPTMRLGRRVVVSRRVLERALDSGSFDQVAS